MLEVPKSSLHDVASILEFAASAVRGLEFDQQCSIGNLKEVAHAAKAKMLGVEEVDDDISKSPSFPIPPHVPHIPFIHGLTDSEPLQRPHVPVESGACENDDKLGEQSPYGKRTSKDIKSFHPDRDFRPEMLKRPWEPLEKVVCLEESKKWALFGVVRFYWIGLTNNTSLKATFLEMHSKLEVLSQRGDTLSEEWCTLQKERMSMEYYEQFGNSNTERRKQIRHESQLLIYEAEDLIRKLEGLLAIDSFGVLNMKVYKALQMASCPLEQFLENYITRRDDALALPSFPPRTFDHHLELEATKEQQMLKEKQMVKAAVRSIAQMETLFTSLRVKIDSNDQLLFKVVVVVLQAATVLGQYVFEKIWRHSSYYGGTD